MKKQWQPPKIKEVRVKEDATSMQCGGKKIGCYAGSSCGSVTIKEQPKLRREPKK